MTAALSLNDYAGRDHIAPRPDGTGVASTCHGLKQRTGHRRLYRNCRLILFINKGSRVNRHVDGCPSPMLSPTAPSKIYRPVLPPAARIGNYYLSAKPGKPTDYVGSKFLIPEVRVGIAFAQLTPATKRPISGWPLV